MSGFEVLVTGAPIGAPFGAVAWTVGLPAASGTKNWSVPESGLFHAVLPVFTYSTVSLTESCPAEGSNRIMCLSTRATPGCLDALYTLIARPVVGRPGGSIVLYVTPSHAVRIRCGPCTV